MRGLLQSFEKSIEFDNGPPMFSSAYKLVTIKRLDLKLDFVAIDGRNLGSANNLRS